MIRFTALQIAADKAIAEYVRNDGTGATLTTADGRRYEGNLAVDAGPDRAPSVRKFLDLSTAHLPPDVGRNGPNSYDGVIAYNADGYGWFMWVPDDVQERIDETEGVIPEAIVTIWKYARERGCDYVLLDRDGPQNADLQTWEW